MFIDQGEEGVDKMFFFAGGGFLSEGGFGQRGIFAGGGFWPQGVLPEGGALVGGGFLLEEGFCPVPIDNNSGYTKY